MFPKYFHLFWKPTSSYFSIIQYLLHAMNIIIIIIYSHKLCTKIHTNNPHIQILKCLCESLEVYMEVQRCSKNSMARHRVAAGLREHERKKSILGLGFEKWSDREETREFWYLKDNRCICFKLCLGWVIWNHFTICSKPTLLFIMSLFIITNLIIN